MTTAFQWPGSKRVAVSLTFDDARPTQPDIGIPLLNQFGVRASFYVTISAMKSKLDAWKAALANGHEIGNHTVSHPCTGNFLWSRGAALENYTLEKMEADLLDANAQIRDLLGVTPTTFAYPCGLTFVGRGLNHQSYVPLIARHFLAGRGFRNESTNQPGFCDLPTVGAYDLDCVSAEHVINLIKAGEKSNAWVIFAGHNVGDQAGQTVIADDLAKICQYCQDPANGVWIDTTHNIASYIKANRPQPA